LTDSDTGTVPQLFKRFLNAYGSPNFFRMPSVEDAYESVLSLTQGVDGFAGLDLYNADFILSFGSALLDGYGAPPRVMQAISRLKEQNGTLVQIEHRLSNTAAKANVWLAAKPGTEADLALSMAYVIIAQQKYDTDFIGTHTEGFEAFVRMVQERFDPQKVAAYCGVEADVIVRTALAFAAAQKPLAVYGKGKGQTAGSLREALAVHALNALVGNINRVGGVQAIPAYDYLQWPAVMTDETAAAGLQTQRLDRARSPEFSHAQAIVHRLFETVNASPGEVQALFVAEANPCYSLPGTAKVQEAFDKIPFVVSFSSYMDETAMQADLILPNHVYLERYEDVPVRSGTTRPMIGLCQPVVAPQLNTRHVGDSVILIAKALKGAVAESFPWADYESCLQEALGDQWDAISDQGFWAAAESAPASWDNGFGTPSGKFTLMNETIAAVYQAGQPSVAGDASDYLLLLMPYDSIRLTSRYVGGTPFMIKTVADTVLKGQDGFVDLNPETAAHIGLGEGQAVRLSTPVGEARVRVHLDDGVMPGIVSIPRGLGHTAQGPFLAGKGVNVNRLIAPVEDPASGLDAAWGIRAKLTKA
jgi:anaerobic selenocysteine-containing dehydrogenase